MRSSSCALRGSAVAVLVLLTAGVVLSGCSSVGSPDEAMTPNSGSMMGRVTTPEGGAVVDVAVSLWGEGMPGEANHVYSTTTDENGDYEFNEVVLDGTHSFQKTYEMYVNRTRGQAPSIVEQYTACAMMVVVERDETTTMNVELEVIESDGMSPAEMGGLEP